MIYLLRHGLDDERYIGGWSEGDLIGGGYEQVIKTAKFIQEHQLPIKQIYTSDVKRAITTAKIVSSHLNLPIIYDSGLRELNKGDLNGMLVKKAVKEYPKYFENVTIDTRYPNGESMKELYERIKIYMARLEKLDNSLIVTHRGVINMLYFILNDIPLNMDKTQFNVTHSSVHKLILKDKKIERIY